MNKKVKQVAEVVQPSAADESWDGEARRQHFAGAVYAATNAADGNAVVHYARCHNGDLETLSVTPTGGRGVGTNNVVPGAAPPGIDPLSSAHALTMHPSKRFFFVANAGDGTLSAFRVGREGKPILSDLQTTDIVQPNTIAAHGDLVYVSGPGSLAQKIAPRLNGFWLTTAGRLLPIENSAREIGPAGGASLPTDIRFTADGTRVIVSDIFANKLLVYPVQSDGTLGEPDVTPSVGPNPFGTVVGGSNLLFVSEAQITGVNSSSVSSYSIEGTKLIPISRSVATGQALACWLSISPDGRFLYSSNTGSGNISIFAVNECGELSLLEGNAVPRAGTTPDALSGPVDSILSHDGRYLYQQYSGLGVIGVYRVSKHGRLHALHDADGVGLPALGSEGLDGF